MKDSLTKTIDFFYRTLPLFKRFVPIQTFRYAAVGGANMVYGIFQYWFIYNYILFQHDLHFGLFVVSAPIATFVINFVITFFTGFFLVKHIAFSQSEVRSRTQMIRYGMVVVLNVLINYFGIKFLVEVCNIFPSVSNALIQIVTVNVSFLINKHFTFKA